MVDVRGLSAAVSGGGYWIDRDAQMLGAPVHCSDQLASLQSQFTARSRKHAPSAHVPTADQNRCEALGGA